MRTKFLLIIACFVFVSVAISSCLDSDTEYVYSSDATVHAFALDTIHGKKYKFEIDQIQRLIFNPVITKYGDAAPIISGTSQLA